MVDNCIVCGKELIDIVCTGQLKGMAVDFCDNHAEYCDNCETVKCRVVDKLDS